MLNNWQEWKEAIQENANKEVKHMRFKVADIIAVNRKRELGDISQLAQSIQEIGLLNPIVIRRDGTLTSWCSPTGSM